MVQLPVSRDDNIRQKFNVAAAKVKCTYFTDVWLAEDILYTQWAIFSVHDRGVGILECHL